jgi:NTE family protein
MYKIGLVLSGGGIRGVAHLGVIKALNEMGIQVDAVSGTSAGAIVGAFHCSGFNTDEILQIVKEKKFFGFSNFLFGKAGFFDMITFKDLYLTYFEDNKIENLSKPLFITATDIVKGELRYFDKGDLDVALMASSCVPMVFQPIEHDGTIFLDGGILNNFPIEPLLNTCDKIIGVHVNSLSKDLNQIHMKDMLDRSFHFTISSQVKHKMKDCSVFIEPPNMSRFGMFDMGKIDEIYSYGYEYALSIAEEIQTAIA